MHSPVIYLNWRALKWAAENGFRYVNFGLTKSASSSAVHRTKKKFGGEFVPSYKFTLPISKISYILASKIGRVLRVARGSVRSEVG